MFFYGLCWTHRINIWSNFVHWFLHTLLTNLVEQFVRVFVALSMFKNSYLWGWHALGPQQNAEEVSLQILRSSILILTQGLDRAKQLHYHF